MKHSIKRNFAGYIVIISIITILIASLAAFLYLRSTSESSPNINTTNGVEIKDNLENDEIEPNQDNDNQIIEKKVNSYDECIAAGYIEYSSIDGPGFCRGPDGTDYYQ